MHSILIVEDEPKVASFIQRGLSAEGFKSDVAQNGNIALQLASEHEYDVITVDLMLPGIDGYKVIEQLRQQNNNAGILILSARDTLEDKLQGFKIGSDDYLAKPFAFEELVARVNALLRRREGVAPTQTELHYADVQLNLAQRTVTRNDREIELTNTEFRLLEYLIRHAEKPCSRTMIAANVWNEHFDRETNIVDVYMMYLRKKIDTVDAVSLIHTVRGVGYILRSHDRSLM